MAEVPKEEQFSEVRENIVQTAVKFLQNPNVSNTPLAQKQKFLQRKGLTDKEIQVACERAGAYVLHDQQSREAPALPIPIQSGLQSMQLQPLTLFQKFKEIVHNVAILSAVIYAVYMFYKKFIRRFLFGDKKKKSVEDQLEELNKSVSSSITDLKESLFDVKIEVDKITQGGEMSVHKQLHDLKAEISTVKGLLLSRKQFPSVSSTSVVPPSIPAWQLSSVTPDPDTIDAKSDDLMEIGSGSSSSEHEQGTKNSESSLEIMYN
ncbi:hypothetical protein RN001_012552 [Aquatica leii]|uniref:Peroxisomal membrane protein PEX14 n=1 Tax=Aquatica leii TaxID=1421715 RepID=A0AAN7NYL0_9COLE|nr:hypothetical protein RN001_012552 [Aquatica leii]